VVKEKGQEEWSFEGCGPVANSSISIPEVTKNI
jgi:hypothetical protein